MNAALLLGGPRCHRMQYYWWSSTKILSKCTFRAFLKATPLLFCWDTLWYIHHVSWFIYFYLLYSDVECSVLIGRKFSLKKLLIFVLSQFDTGGEPSRWKVLHFLAPLNGKLHLKLCLINFKKKEKKSWQGQSEHSTALNGQDLYLFHKNIAALSNCCDIKETKHDKMLSFLGGGIPSICRLFS